MKESNLEEKGVTLIINKSGIAGSATDHLLIRTNCGPSGEAEWGVVARARAEGVAV